ncbi:hypothetical protein ColTof4_01880 [Colletotrichum tofieldiae]|uniref:Uncharacterized protein n=1 Tax=Colletotrichum liriopes TaxID=708192 RepID=A0AA37LSL4_9PEZI|nr:hypothetical protein ColLi_05574 [Colletotrichum liriopes]GKT62495.1 hypothetical protein ColTof3_09834 [Colletotrichum tofieldiae]GKT69457.1 hypothetical protein ColTof4_01880 [Colletotrichum tofieldiae]GKT96238.1 hypothetical protein Ct61P_14088 [Colletotrichum tofieldiae]
MARNGTTNQGEGSDKSSQVATEEATAKRQETSCWGARARVGQERNNATQKMMQVRKDSSGSGQTDSQIPDAWNEMEGLWWETTGSLGMVSGSWAKQE